MFCKFCGCEMSDNAVFCNRCGKKLLENTNAGVSPTPRQNANVSGGVLIVCPVCGHAISSQAESCPNCGHKTQAGIDATRNKENVQFENYARVILIISFIVGVIGIFMLFSSLGTISSDLQHHRYTYSQPFTSHEQDTLFQAFIAVVLTGASIGCDIGIAIRGRKNKK